MSQFEEELKKALCRVDPPGDFTARVLANVARQENVKQSARNPALRWHSPRLRFASVFALLLVLFTGLTYRDLLRKKQGEAAKKQLLIAMHIAGTQLHEAQLRVKRIEFPGVAMQ